MNADNALKAVNEVLQQQTEEQHETTQQEAREMANLVNGERGQKLKTIYTMMNNEISSTKASSNGNDRLDMVFVDHAMADAATMQDDVSRYFSQHSNVTS